MKILGTTLGVAAGIAIAATGARSETVLRVSTWTPPTHFVNAKIWPQWGEAVKKATGGRVTIKQGIQPGIAAQAVLRRPRRHRPCQLHLPRLQHPLRRHPDRRDAGPRHQRGGGGGRLHEGAREVSREGQRASRRRADRAAGARPGGDPDQEAPQEPRRAQGHEDPRARRGRQPRRQGARRHRRQAAGAQGLRGAVQPASPTASSCRWRRRTASG